MKFLPKNMLAHYNAAPQVHQHDLSALQTSVFSAATLKYRATCGQTLPTQDAVTFYTLNHCASIIRKSFTDHETLPYWAEVIMENYTDVCMKQGERMLHYILSITAREMRHLQHSTSVKVWTELDKQFSQTAVLYLKDLSSHGSESVAVDKYMKHPPALTVGAYTKALAYAFHHGTWSGGYGSKAWGEVTDALVSMLTGTTSMEMLVDTGYTLAHNGGPIFNKGMMYTTPNTNDLLTILDVQRAGQMLDLMFETDTMGVQKTDLAETTAGVIKQFMPREIKGFVDWKLVDALRPEKEKSGTPNKYAKVTGVQKQATPKPLGKKVKAAAPKKPLMTTLLGKPVKVTGTWQVYPHQTVQVVERVAE